MGLKQSPGERSDVCMTGTEYGRSVHSPIHALRRTPGCDPKHIARQLAVAIAVMSGRRWRGVVAIVGVVEERFAVEGTHDIHLLILGEHLTEITA